MRALPRLAQQVGRSASTSSSKSFQGVWPIVATPFHDDESLDLEGFAKIAPHLEQSLAPYVTRPLKARRLSQKGHRPAFYKTRSSNARNFDKKWVKSYTTKYE